MPTVLMSKSTPCSEDGINVVNLAKGERYNVSDKLAQTLVYTMKVAELVEDIAVKPPPPASTFPAAPVDPRLPAPAAPPSKPVHVHKAKAKKD